MPVKREMMRLFAVFREVTGASVDMSNFKHRLILQKMAYLLQARGKTTAYNFNWYIRGPYCSNIATDAYDTARTQIPSATREDVENARWLKELLSDNVDDSNFELFASIKYLINERKLTDDEEIVFAILSSKPWFTREQVVKAIEKIKLVKA